jgi:uncharacterized protein (UPF0548 family)
LTNYDFDYIIFSINTEILELKLITKMYALQKPSLSAIQGFIEQEEGQPFSYPAVGATRTLPPSGYTVDHNRICLGCGLETFASAKAALKRWEMFKLSWVQLCWPDAPVVEGTTVAVLVRAWGVWSLNACRIVYTVEEDGAVARCGFAYGTLSDHAERGEEQFTVAWHKADDTVWYDIFAFSQPKQWLSRLGYPLVRRLQRRFARESLAAMHRAVATPTLNKR